MARGEVLKPYYKYLFVFLLIGLVFTFSGCSLLMLPFKVAEGLLALLGKLLQVADALPKPPPGVIPGYP